MTRTAYLKIKRGLEPTAIRAWNLATSKGFNGRQKEDYISDAFLYILGQLPKIAKDEESYIKKNYKFLVLIGKRRILELLTKERIYTRDNLLSFAKRDLNEKLRILKERNKNDLVK